MKRDRMNLDSTLDRHLGLFNSPSADQMNASWDRVQQRLESASDTSAPPSTTRSTLAHSRKAGLLRGLAAVAAIVVVLLGVSNFFYGSRALAVVENSGGPLYRLSGGKEEALQPGHEIRGGEVVYSNEANGGVLALKDGSRVEMRSRSELLLQEARDGALVQLNAGSIIVSAAKQTTGHLYVQTRDFTVPATGGVFLVNAEAEGSHVAVIQGEVQVQQGTTSKKLLSGEQVVTNPSVVPASVTEGISWSKQAEEHLASLQVPQQNLAEAPPAFELVSIRPVAPSAGGRGAGSITGCVGTYPRVDPRRFVVRASLYTLITWAYSRNGCLYTSALNLLSGAPQWVRSDEFEIEGILPAGTPGYTPQQIVSGNAPVLQAMTRSMLADRFKLVVRHELKEVPLYLLKTGRGAPKLEVSKSEDKAFNGMRTYTDSDGKPFERVEGGKASMATLANTLSLATGRPVTDQTGLTGEFNFHVDYAAAKDPNSTRPTIFEAIQDQLGLRLEAAKDNVETLVIERAERPSEN
jgi:uncharacterized protein (TIGR03435 family)